MKKVGIFFLYVSLIFIFVPISAYALDNYLEVSFNAGSGDLKFSGVAGKADTESTEIGLFYTHYFKALESDGSPYGVREFLQHPSFIGGGYISYDWEAEDDVNDRIDYNSNSVGFGGMFYTLDSDYSTGVGLLYLSRDSDLDMIVGGVTVLTSESESKTPTLMVEQYINKNTRISLSYSMSDDETNDVSHDENILTVELSTLIDNFWLSAYFKNGKDDWPSGYSDDDISGYGFTVGGYLNQKLGLFFSYISEETDDGTSELDITNTSFTGDLYLNERVHLIGSLNFYEEDDPTFAKIEETIVTLGAGIYF